MVLDKMILQYVLKSHDRDICYFVHLLTNSSVNILFNGHRLTEQSSLKLVLIIAILIAQICSLTACSVGRGRHSILAAVLLCFHL